MHTNESFLLHKVHAFSIESYLQRLECVILINKEFFELIKNYIRVSPMNSPEFMMDNINKETIACIIQRTHIELALI